MKDRNPNPWSQVLRYVSLATMLPLSGLGGYVVGYYLDHIFSTHYLNIVFVVLGSIGGFIQLIHGLDKE